jgi:hypothetical protein
MATNLPRKLIRLLVHGEVEALSAVQNLAGSHYVHFCPRIAVCYPYAFCLWLSHAVLFDYLFPLPLFSLLSAEREVKPTLLRLGALPVIIRLLKTAPGPSDGREDVIDADDFEIPISAALTLQNIANSEDGAHAIGHHI